MVDIHLLHHMGLRSCRGIGGKEMIVIRNRLTGERFSFPSYNVNAETPTGFIQYQLIPKGFMIDPDQINIPDPLQVHAVDMEMHQYVETTNYEAHSKDPLNTRKEW
jgi:hypothetical protein